MLGSYFESYPEYYLMDYPYPWLISRNVIVMPVPKSSVNISAVWKPFMPEVTRTKCT